jgi:hypothetical protein
VEKKKDGQTDMTKLIFAFINFAYAPKNSKILKIMHRARVGGVTENIIVYVLIFQQKK